MMSKICIEHQGGMMSAVLDGGNCHSTNDSAIGGTQQEVCTFEILGVLIHRRGDCSERKYPFCTLNKPHTTTKPLTFFSSLGRKGLTQ